MSKIEIMHTKNSKTLISSEKGKVKIVLNSHLSSDRKSALIDIMDEILQDLGGKDFKGKFSFDGDYIEITLESTKDKKTWTKQL